MDSFLTPYDLSNSGEEKLQLTPFWGGPKPGCSDSVCAGIIKSHNFLVLRPMLPKNAYFSSANRQLSIAVWLVELGWRKIVDPSRAAPQSSIERNFSKFSAKKLRVVMFYPLSDPAETPYLSVRDGKLSNAVRLVKFRPRKVAVHTLLEWSQARMSRRPSRRNYRKP